MKHSTALCTLAIASTFAWPVAAWSECEAKSGAKTAALVELYTSEGCSSCPPADQRLARLGAILGVGAEAVPLALHVDYWDYIGWHDQYAKGAFTMRQNRLVELNHPRTVYTPHFFVGGTELGLRQDELLAEVERVNGVPAQAEIRVKADVETGGVLSLSVHAAAQSKSAALYLAVTEGGLTSKVTRGENGGATLHHEHVVREWIGPIRLAGGTADAQRDITLPAAWNRARLDVVAFVEDESSGVVLQAVSASQCARS
jgi:hypothetical protein